MIKSVALLSILMAVALASHGRFGTVRFSKDLNDPQTVTFTLQAVFRRSYSSWARNVGGTVSLDSTFAWGDGGAVTPTATITNINVDEDWSFFTWSGVHRYAGAGNFRAGLSGCCRISTLQNNRDYSYSFFANVRITSDEIAKVIPANQSPVSGMLPIVPVPYNSVPFTYQIVASDPDNNPITFSMADATQMGQAGSTNPPGLSVSSSGLVTLTTVLAQGFWSTQQIVTDSFGNWIAIDYMLNVQPAKSYCNGNCQNGPNPECVGDFQCSTCNATCVQALPRIITNDISGSALPKTNRPAPANQQTFNRNVGQQVVIDFVADDENLVNPDVPVSIYQGNMPVGSSMTAQVECNAASNCECVGCNGKPQFRSFTWTPTSSDLGSNTVCVGVKSKANFLPYAQHCVTINVIALPITSGAMTTKPLTTEALTTQPLTTQEMTTQPLTTGDITTQPLTTELLTTQEMTTQEMTTQELTTQELTTQPLTTQPLTTQPLTTDFFTVADRCATYSWPESQGWFCSADQTGYYQCLKGPWASQAKFRPCAPGTTCKCPVGVECSSTGICTF